MWFDSHCHIDLPGFSLAMNELWAEARAHGVSRAFVPGVDPTQWSRLETVRSLHGVSTGVGLHPFALEPWSTLPEPEFALQVLRALDGLTAEAHSNKHVAIGECGWDKPLAKRNPRLTLELQTQIVVRHLHVARDTGLPVVLHIVHAHGLALQILERNPVPMGGVVHAFSGAPELVERYQRLGFRLGFGPAVLAYPKVEQALRVTARDHLVLETDAPLAPRWHTYCTNSPSAVVAVGRAVAEKLSIPLAELAALTSRTSSELFRTRA